MKIIDLFRRLSFGELSNLAISAEGSGTIIEAKQASLIHAANEGLVRLYSRFNLRQKDLLIEQVAHITNYHLRRQFAESAGGEDDDPDAISHPYIKDLPCEPFEEDVIRILEVYDRSGSELPLNDVGRSDSLFTPQPDVLQVPSPREGEPLAVIYQARHPVLRDVKLRDDEDLLQQHISLPFYLEGALQSFIAWHVHNNMNGQENVAKAQIYLGAFEAICVEAETKDLVNQTAVTSHRKFQQRGFV